MSDNTNSHSGDEQRPTGGFKTLNYNQDGMAQAKTVNAADSAGGDQPAGETAQKQAGTDLESLTVAELHQKASDLNIEGRSELKTKDDLVSAVRKAQRKAK